jgi:hypothetical protein
LPAKEGAFWIRLKGLTWENGTNASFSALKGLRIPNFAFAGLRLLDFFHQTVTMPVLSQKIHLMAFSSLLEAIVRNNIKGLVKSHNSDGTVKSSRCKAHESLGMRRTYQYAAVTKGEAQRRRWTFYEAVNIK